MKRDHHLTPYTKVNSEWIKDLSVRPEAIKLLKENMSTLTLIDDDFLFVCFDTKNKGYKSKNKQVGLYQTKNFYIAKETINKMKR